jgi:hypothetical protein
MTWLRVSSSAGIADAASVLVNAMDQRHGSGRRNSRVNLARLGKGPGRKGFMFRPVRTTSDSRRLESAGQNVQRLKKVVRPPNQFMPGRETDALVEAPVPQPALFS